MGASLALLIPGYKSFSLSLAKENHMVTLNIKEFQPVQSIPEDGNEKCEWPGLSAVRLKLILW